MAAAFSTSLEAGKAFLGVKRIRRTNGSSSLHRNRISYNNSGSFGRKRDLVAASLAVDSAPSCDYSITAVPNQEAFSQIRHRADERKRRSDAVVTPEKLDDWVRDSIGEIVRNIGEAPFLVHIFRKGPSSVLRLVREEASPENWPRITKRWDQPNSTPDGIILVQELKDGDMQLLCNNNDDNNDNDDKALSLGGAKRTWGLVIQGRGMDCAASCYILNTCRVRSPAGFCTHFCLSRAKCFGESLDKQLRNAWLLT